MTAAGIAAGSPAGDGVNVILITVDTLRADHLGCYGYAKNTSPNMDAFARNALFFERAYSPAPVTIPALRAILTGVLISNSSQQEIISYYHDSTFLAQILKEKGYVTAAFTDHLGLGKKPKKAPRENHRSKPIVKGFDIFDNCGRGRNEVTSQKLTDRALAWLEENQAERFFLWVHYFDPHFNYAPLPEYRDMFGFSRAGCGRISNGIDIQEIRKIETTLTRREVQCLVGLYDAEISFTDRQIGRLLHKLEQHDLYRRSIVVITADHGEEFKERTRVGHERTLYDEVIRVPLMMRIPGRKPARIRKSTETTLLFEFLSGPQVHRDFETPDKDVISRTFHYYKDGRSEPNEFSIISGDYKLIHDPLADKDRLFDLKEDAGERHDLSGRHAFRSTKRRLKRRLSEWISRMKVSVSGPSQEAIKSEEELNERLRSLGYVR